MIKPSSIELLACEQQILNSSNYSSIKMLVKSAGGTTGFLPSCYQCQLIAALSYINHIKDCTGCQFYDVSKKFKYFDTTQECARICLNAIQREHYLVYMGIVVHHVITKKQDTL